MTCAARESIRVAPKLLVTTAHTSLFQHPDPDTGAPIHENLGRLLQPRHTSCARETAQAGIPWAADNDCFQGLDSYKFVDMLDRLTGLPGCRFVAVPDKVADAATTMEMFEEWQPIIDDRGLPCALVAQDGIDKIGVPWDAIAALFIGGSTEFKLGDVAADFARQAIERGKLVHWGRVNTEKRFRQIMATGAVSSFDGSSFARWRRTLLDVGLAWTREAA